MLEEVVPATRSVRTKYICPHELRFKKNILDIFSQEKLSLMELVFHAAVIKVGVLRGKIITLIVYNKGKFYC